MNALEIQNLTKHFPSFSLDNISFTLPSGCILGLVGENGAGKSTTIKLILDMLHKDSGSVTILGRDNTDNIRLTKEDVGVVMDEVGLPQCLNIAQIERIMALTYQRWDKDRFWALTEQLALPKKKAFKTFSRGMKMKLGIAIALSHQAKLLLLDEATSGLDPVVRDEVVSLFSDFTRDENHSILISSHIVSDLEKLCDYIAFMHKGKLLLFEEKDRLLETYGLLHCTCQQLADLPEAAVLHSKSGPYGAQALVLRSAAPDGLPISPINIEDLFIYMVKEAK